jgi:hypothetical protein
MKTKTIVVRAGLISTLLLGSLFSVAACGVVADSEPVQPEEYTTIAGEMKLPPNVQVAADIRLSNGNQALFLTDGKSWNVIELGAAGNAPMAKKLMGDAQTPQEQFKRLAPGKEVPEAIAKLPAPPEGRTSTARRDELQQEAEEFKQLKKDNGVPEDAPAPSDQGLDQASACSATWFNDNVCVGHIGYFGAVPNISWWRPNRTSRSIFDRSAWNGESYACADIGSVTLKLNNRDFNVEIGLLNGYYGWTGAWSTWQGEELCSGWSCETYWFPQNVQTRTEVTDVATGERFHFCGWMDDRD